MRVHQLTPNQTHALLDNEIGYLRAVERGLSRLPLVFTQDGDRLVASITFEVSADLNELSIDRAKALAAMTIGQAIAIMAHSAGDETQGAAA